MLKFVSKLLILEVGRQHNSGVIHFTFLMHSPPCEVDPIHEVAVPKLRRRQVILHFFTYNTSVYFLDDFPTDDFII